MSKTYRHGDRRIRVRGIRRAEPDLRKLARALVDLAQAQAEVEAEQAQVEAERIHVGQTMNVEVDLPEVIEPDESAA